MILIWFFNSLPQYCLLSRWFFPDPEKVLWVGNNPSDLLHCSHLTRGPGSGLLSLLFWPLSMMLIVAPLRQRKVSYEPKIMFRNQVPDLPDFVDLAAPLPNDRSNHVVGDRHLMPGFWFSIQRYQKNRNFYIWKPSFVFILFKGYVRPEVPISAIISPRPASSTSSGSSSKVCYCVERGTEK